MDQPKIPDNILLDVFGIMLMFLGFFIMMLGGYEFYKRGIISALSQKETKEIDSNKAVHELVTTGIYRYFRHLQYVGLFIFIIGYFLFLDAFFALCFCPLILGWFGVIAYIEERYDLELMFGEEYQRYKKKTGMIFPKISD